MIDTAEFIHNLGILHESIDKDKEKDKNEEMASTLILFIRLTNRNAFEQRIFRKVYELASIEKTQYNSYLSQMIINLKRFYNKIITHKNILLSYLQKNKSITKSTKTGFIVASKTLIIEEKKTIFDSLTDDFKNILFLYNQIKFRNYKYVNENGFFSFLQYEKRNYTVQIEEIYNLLLEIEPIISGGFDILLYENEYIYYKLMQLSNIASQIEDDSDRKIKEVATELQILSGNMYNLVLRVFSI